MDLSIGKHPVNCLRVLIVDEDKNDANRMRDMLHQQNYHVTMFTSPREALNFLNDRAHDIDFLLVAVEMEEIPGFEFLDMVTKMHENIQVIMVSTMTTTNIMMRCVKLGARFLVDKPLESVTIRNLWQYLDLGDRKIDLIRHLFQGPRADTHVIPSNSTNSSVDKESMNNNISEVQSSTGNNSIDMGLVNHSDSKDGEIVEKGPKGDESSEVETSPSNSSYT